MTEFYKWISDCEDLIIEKAHEITGIKASKSFITIESLYGRYGEYRPEAATFHDEIIDVIALEKKLFKFGEKFVLQVLAHEVLHVIEKIEYKLDDTHGRNFKTYEKFLNSWIEVNCFEMPEFYFESSRYQVAKGVSKTIVYLCPCGTEITHLQEIDINCNKCGHKFYIENDGRKDFDEAFTDRKKSLFYSAAKLLELSDEDIVKYAPLSLKKQLSKIVTPLQLENPLKSELDGTETKEILDKVYRGVLNINALQDVTIEHPQLGRVLYLLNGRGDNSNSNGLNEPTKQNKIKEKR